MCKNGPFYVAVVGLIPLTEVILWQTYIYIDTNKLSNVQKSQGTFKNIVFSYTFIVFTHAIRQTGRGYITNYYKKHIFFVTHLSYNLETVVERNKYFNPITFTCDD